MLERRCEGIHLEVSNFWSFFGGQKCEASNGEFFAAKREEIRQEWAKYLPQRFVKKMGNGDESDGGGRVWTIKRDEIGYGGNRRMQAPTNQSQVRCDRGHGHARLSERRAAELRCWAVMCSYGCRHAFPTRLRTRWNWASIGWCASHPKGCKKTWTASRTRRGQCADEGFASPKWHLAQRPSSKRAWSIPKMGPGQKPLEGTAGN